MKKLFLFLFLALSPTLFAQNNVSIPAAKTIAALPLLELNGKTLAGITIQTPFFDDHALAMAEFLSGKTQLLLTGTSLGMKNAQSGGPIVHLSTVVWDINSLICLDPALKTLSDFSGKTILVPIPGGPVDLEIKALIKAQKLEGKIRIDYAEPVQAAALLMQKKADGAVLPEPLASKLVLTNNAHAAFPLSQAWATINHGDGRAPMLSIFVRKDFAARNPDFLKALIAELQKTTAAVKASPAVFAQKYASIMGLPQPVLQKGIENTLFEIPGVEVQKNLFQTYQNLIEDKRPLPASFFFLY